MRPAWRGTRCACREYASPSVAGLPAPGKPVVPGRPGAVEWPHDPRRAPRAVPHPGAPGRQRRRPRVRRRPRRAGAPHLPAGCRGARCHGRGSRRGSATTPTTGSSARWRSSGGRGQVVEWKTYGYDEPADLPERLVRAGFVAQDPEVVLIGRCADLVHDVDAARGHPAARDHVRRGLGAGAGERRPGLGRGHLVGQRRPARRAAPRPRPADRRRRRGRGHPRGAVLRRAARCSRATDFCGLWGGSTLPEWRGRGLYRALTSHRAERARDLGYPLARVDTSPDSRPILVGLGMHAVADTRPYLLEP